MKRLMEIGFQYAGHWKLAGDQLECELGTFSRSEGVLYAFLSNGEIKYIGKTTTALKTRFSGYRKPARTQSTNIKNNANIRSLLERDEPVDIFVLVDDAMLSYGGYRLNLAAGLEDSLIQQISPPWNGGRKESDQMLKDSVEASSPSVEEASMKPEADVEAETSDRGDPLGRFNILLGKTYYSKGFFNVKVEHQELFGANGDVVDVHLGSVGNPVKGYVNRTANSNGSPRIMVGVEMTNWLQGQFREGDVLSVSVLSGNSILLGDEYEL